MCVLEGTAVCLPKQILALLIWCETRLLSTGCVQPVCVFVLLSTSDPRLSAQEEAAWVQVSLNNAALREAWAELAEARKQWHSLQVEIQTLHALVRKPLIILSAQPTPRSHTNTFPPLVNRARLCNTVAGRRGLQ